MWQRRDRQKKITVAEARLEPGEPVASNAPANAWVGRAAEKNGTALHLGQVQYAPKATAWLAAT
jgi:hypothetical protein